MKQLNKYIKSEKGVIMVEASIYFPIVLAIVFAFIYVSLWKIEDCVIYFAAQKVANSAANAIAHQDYEKLYGDIGGDVVTIDTSIDFNWKGSDAVPEQYVKNYYSNVDDKKLYTRVKIKKEDYVESMKKLIEATKFVPFKLGVNDVEVEVDHGLLRSVVTVNATIGFNTPGIMRYIGFDDEFKFQSKGYQFVTEPAEFVRNTDLAFDLVDYLFERLGISDKIGAFTDKWNKIADKFGLNKD